MRSTRPHLSRGSDQTSLRCCPLRRCGKLFTTTVAPFGVVGGIFFKPGGGVEKRRLGGGWMVGFFRRRIDEIFW